MAEIEQELKKYAPAFELLASDDLKLFKCILKEMKSERIVINKTLSVHINWSKTKIKNLINKWVDLEIIEKIMQCPYCKAEFENYITPICANCQKRIIQKDIKFKNKKYYPRFIIGINKTNKEILIDFFRFCSTYLKFLLK